MTAALSNLSRRPRALVVDGDAAHRELYRASLTIAGWDVAEAVDGCDALVQVLSARTSLVLTELCLSLIDGVSLCEILRKDPMTSTVPILVVTSEIRATEIARATWAGASAVLIKPSVPALIISEMNRLTAPSISAVSLHTSKRVRRRPAAIQSGSDQHSNSGGRSGGNR